MHLFRKPYLSATNIKKLSILMIISSLCYYGFAVDNLIDGGKKSKVFSTIKSDLSFSLKSGYNFQSHRINATKKSNVRSSGFYITYHRDNVTLALPYKGKSKILQKFRTPERPQ